MPTWGLTREQRDSAPWGIDPLLLAPHKTITDPVHGDVYLNRVEMLIVDSPPMQRLRRVRQLGTTNLVYPGATQSRFSHALGTLRASQDLLDAVWNSQTNPQQKKLDDNLLASWAEAGADFLNAEFARATVLARLGGLMHDLCHVPIGHTIEDDLGVLDAHDAGDHRFNILWEQLDSVARDAIDQADELKDELRVLIVSKDEFAKAFQPRYPFVQDIVGNTICADLIDYIRRDHHNTGLPLALGRRFLDSFYVVPEDHPYFAKRMVINIEREGRRREDIVTELVKYLRYRYELTERVLTHHAKTAADAMLGKMLELWNDDLFVAHARSKVGESALPVDAPIADHRQALDDTTRDEILGTVKDEIEAEFLRRSDDSMLEYLRDAPPGSSRRRNAAAGLAADLLDRRLYKATGRAAAVGDHAVAQAAFEEFSKGQDGRQRRRDLEQDAAAFAGLSHGWQCVLWLPNPDMRLKVAKVLVSQSGAIAELSTVDAASRELEQAHHRLWAATVYTHASVGRDQADAVLAYLVDRTALRFCRPDGSPVPGKFELAVERMLRDHHELAGKRDALLRLTPSGSGSGSLASLLTSLKRAARSEGLLPSAR